jgi:hypothetical protein
LPHAIIRGRNGRRHEVDFGDSPIRVELYGSGETIELFTEADFETLVWGPVSQPPIVGLGELRFDGQGKLPANLVSGGIL